jgi:hypothetical protein
MKSLLSKLIELLLLLLLLLLILRTDCVKDLGVMTANRIFIVMLTTYGH